MAVYATIYLLNDILTAGLIGLFLFCVILLTKLFWGNK